MLNTAVKAARKAGSIITRASFDVDKLTIRSKQQNDFVSEVDHAAEEAIISVLKDAYPDHGFLAEESGYKDPNAEFLWIIDPLDGTTNFLHGLPHWAVSIALEHKREIVAGIVYDPVKDEIFVAEKGAAALDLAYVAAGRLDGYWERGLNPWDVAAGILLVREAGGFVGPIEAEGDPLEGGSIAAANANVYEPLRTILREA